MNYVGKLLSNVKGFYNEINSATLTGAIDIVIVQLEDGSYVTSPWHVRFGKMGVLRSREKIVDIEVNGEPVSLHMKLGEAGEAFFVHETETGDEIPLHLATSPLPDTLHFMEAGIKSLKEEAAREARDSLHPIIDREPSLDGVKEPIESLENSMRYIQMDDGSAQIDPNQFSRNEFSSTSTIIRDESKASLYYSPQASIDENLCKHGTVPGASIGIQTEMTAEQVITKTRIRVASGGDKKPSAQPAKVTIESEVVKTDSTITIKAESSKTDSSKSKAGSSEGSQTQNENSKSSQTDPAKMMSPPKADVKSRKHRKSGDEPKSREERAVSECNTQEDGEGSGSSIEVPDGAMFDMDLSDHEGDCPQITMGVGRTVSMPLIDVPSKHDMTDEWANSQLASHFHPFSDGDITPIVSPMGSRPPTPKSDTEYENQAKYDVMSQTNLTGDNMQDVDDVKWEWGQLPETTSTIQTTEEGAGGKDTPKGNDADDKAASGGLLGFMRKTKKIRHQPEQEGIYLDDLNLGEMDPEIAALYLYNAKSSVSNMRKDEDNESGRGASLPQSPVTVENTTEITDQGQQKSYQSVSQGVQMSLCGGLRESNAEIPQEKFMQYLVTYDQFTQNPNILADPNLVIRFDDKYYNWQTAGPMLMSIIAFERPLPEPSVEGLLKEHMPKKESRRRGWFWFRTNDVGTSTSSPTKKDTEGNAETIASSPGSSVTSSPVKKEKKERKKPKLKKPVSGARLEDRFSSDDESDTSLGKDVPLTIDTVLSNDIAAQTSPEIFQKSLKLTSDQIAKLNLREGVNEVVFSVTTQYQGTSRCQSYIYLWKWDDRIIISDIDGTITKSDVLGQVLPMIGKDWSQVGIANLYNLIARNGYKFVYLSARAIGQSKITRDYLKGVRQGPLSLPDGPLLLSPSSLISAFHREVIERKPEEFKIGCLRDISALFPTTTNPFYSGFGNKINDVWAYRAVGIPISRIFTVNSRGELKLELMDSFQSTYTKLSDMVDHLFPPLLDDFTNSAGKKHAGNFHAPSEYSQFTYWREPIPEIEVEDVK